MGRLVLILLDTHAVIWLTAEPSRLSPAARAAIDRAREAEEPLAVCDVTLLELATLKRKGRLGISISLEALLHEIETHFVVLPISGRACALCVTFPAAYPNDPADRIIGATSVVEGAPLITADRQIRESKVVHTIW
jgi:PIN domain nuclease of toxin-antitoxin system